MLRLWRRFCLVMSMTWRHGILMAAWDGRVLEACTRTNKQETVAVNAVTLSYRPQTFLNLTQSASCLRPAKQ